MRRLRLCLLLSALGLSTTLAQRTETAVLGAGCFWCVEAIYEQFPGVTDVVSGYAGGTQPNPTYDRVSAGRTDHVEVVEITFDPDRTTYRALIDYFWQTHDVTDGTGVWPDFGPHYRSIILPATDEQLATALASRDAAQPNFPKPIATEIKKLTRFYAAEDYHQDYVRQNPRDRYVRNIAIPKLKKLGLKTP